MCFLVNCISLRSKYLYYLKGQWRMGVLKLDRLSCHLKVFRAPCFSPLSIFHVGNLYSCITWLGLSLLGIAAKWEWVGPTEDIHKTLFQPCWIMSVPWTMNTVAHWIDLSNLTSYLLPQLKVPPYSQHEAQQSCSVIHVSTQTASCLHSHVC